LNPIQKEELRHLVAGLSGKERKDLARRAAEARAQGQRDKSNPRNRWCVDRWSLHLLRPTGGLGGEEGTIVSVAKARACVRIDGEDRACEMTREILERQQTALAPGDRVVVEARGDSWRIMSVLERKTELTRRDPHIKERERAVVANVDVVAIVVSVVAPPLHPRLIDRYLAAIHKGGATAMVVVNKIDLHESEEELGEDLAQLEPYREMGVQVIAVSTETEEGIEEVRAAISG
jgi:ribosome biogenesis GTPase